MGKFAVFRPDEDEAWLIIGRGAGDRFGVLIDPALERHGTDLDTFSVRYAGRGHHGAETVGTRPGGLKGPRQSLRARQHVLGLSPYRGRDLSMPAR